MKNNKLTFLALLFYLLFSNWSVAQPAESYIDVNGVRVGTHMTSEQIATAFGEYDRHAMSDDGSLVGLDETYYFGSNSVSLMDKELYAFSVYGQGWTVLTDSFPGGLGIGTSVSVVEADIRFVLLPHPTMASHYYLVNESSMDPSDDSYILLEVHDNKIAGITYQMNYW